MRAGPKPEPPKSTLPALRSKTPAGRVEEFGRRFLIHVKGRYAGKPLQLTPWQREEIVQPLFNTRSGGKRVYRRCYCTMPRKNGKSTLGAMLALYLLYYDDEPGAEIISAAADTDQAAIVFDVARSMVEASPALRDVTQIYRRELVVPSLMGSRYRVISAEAGTKHGMNVSGAILDELHVWESRDLYDVLETSTGGREQPLLVILTTAGDDEHGICAEVHHQAERVLAGTSLDPTLLPVIYAAPPDAEITDPKVWAACNPGLGTFRSLDEMRAMATQAREVPGREPAFRRFYLNQWGVGLAPRWLDLAAWDACPPPAAAVAGARVFLGLDLSTTMDLTALACLVPDADGGFDVTVDFWCPEASIQRRSQQDRVPYAQWVREGYLTATPGDVVDYTYIEGRLHALMARYDVQAIGVDPWNAKGLIAKWHTDNLPVLEVAQTMANLSSASKALETLIKRRQLRHGGNPLLRWCIGNAVADLDGNDNVKPSKKKSTERIDGVSALVTGLAQAIVATSGSVYDQRGLAVV